VERRRPDQKLIDADYADMNARQRRARTLASAIEINRPVNLKKCLRALAVCDGVVREVSDEEILDAKAQVGAGGFGCEPASAASIAGARLLRSQGMIAPTDRVVCILTGHQLKDPNATVQYHAGGDGGTGNGRFRNAPVVVENDLAKILEVIQQTLHN
jgi:threonine synthase